MGLSGIPDFCPTQDWWELRTLFLSPSQLPGPAFWGLWKRNSWVYGPSSLWVNGIPSFATPFFPSSSLVSQSLWIGECVVQSSMDMVAGPLVLCIQQEHWAVVLHGALREAHLFQGHWNWLVPAVRRMVWDTLSCDLGTCEHSFLEYVFFTFLNIMDWT